MECNPSSLSRETLHWLLDHGVTRLTLGIQSLDDRLLRLLGRVHTAQQALDALAEPLLSRFASAGADIIYGVPGQSAESLANGLEKLLRFPVIKHLSAYELTLHPRTPFGRHARRLPLPSEEELIAMSRLAASAAASHGFARYEVSNYAKPGHQCQHNLRYWEHTPYVGLGPAAHSFWGVRRWANVANVSDYADKLTAGGLPRLFEETLDGPALGRETIFLRMRTTGGLDERLFEERSGEAFATPSRLPVLNELIASGLMEHTGSRWRLTADGLLLADGIAARLI